MKIFLGQGLSVDKMAEWGHYASSVVLQHAGCTFPLSQPILKST
jgi:hypothetical protein